MFEVARLSPEERDDVLRTIVTIDRQACGPDVDRYWSARPDFFDEVTTVLIAESEGEPVAFCSFCYWPAGDETSLYMDHLVVRPEFRTSSLAKRLVSEFVADVVAKGHTRFFVLGRTENPVALHAFRAGFGAATTYPQFESTSRIPDHVLAAAERTRARLWPEAILDRSCLILRGAYAPMGGTFTTDPIVPTPEVARFFEHYVDTSRGDAVLIVSYLDVSPLTLSEEIHGDDLIEQGDRLRGRT
jgi:predicted N-acetyltransferase YhbS